MIEPGRVGHMVRADPCVQELQGARVAVAHDVNACAFGAASPAPDATLCDAGCGPGAGIEGLLAHVPRGRVVAVDLHAPFVAPAQARHVADPRVDVRVGHIAALPGPFAGIRCAGALYFFGVSAGLEAFRAALTPGDFVALSHPFWFEDAPSEAARGFLEGEDAQITGRGCGPRSRPDGADAVRLGGRAGLGSRAGRDDAAVRLRGLHRGRRHADRLGHGGRVRSGGG